VAVHRDTGVLGTRRGVAGLPALHDRIGFMQSGGHASRRQAQLELRPFDAARLESVGLRLRVGGGDEGLVVVEDVC